MEIYAIKANKNYTLNIPLGYTSPETRERLRGFRNREEAHRVLLGDLLVRAVLCKNNNLRNENIRFGIDNYGKPYLDFPPVHFNKSHSGEWVVCAFDDYPAGIDVERICPIDYQIAKQIFSTAEYDDLMQVPDAERQRYFYALWTLKESYVKYKGRGLFIPLNSFSIKAIDNKIIFSGSRPEELFFQTYHIAEDYIISVCSGKKQFPGKIIKLDLSSILSILGNV